MKSQQLIYRKFHKQYFSRIREMGGEFYIIAKLALRIKSLCDEQKSKSVPHSESAS